MPALKLIKLTTTEYEIFYLNVLSNGGGQLSLSEQPALRAGITTLFDGFKILAVSAMKCTPAKTIISAGGFFFFFSKPTKTPI